MAKKRLTASADVNAVDLMEASYFFVKINHHQSRTPEHLKRFGVRVTGNQTLDEINQNRTVETQLNIWAIFDMWKRGTNIAIVPYDDTARMYTIVHKHLSIWKNFLGHAVHDVPDELLEELVDLDRFCESLYGSAVNVFSDAERQALVNINMPFAERINALNVFKDKAHVKSSEVFEKGSTRVAPKAKKGVTVAARSGYSDLFAEVLSRQKGWRK